MCTGHARMSTSLMGQPDRFTKAAHDCAITQTHRPRTYRTPSLTILGILRPAATCSFQRIHSHNENLHVGISREGRQWRAGRLVGWIQPSSNAGRRSSSWGRRQRGSGRRWGRACSCAAACAAGREVGSGMCRAALHAHAGCSCCNRRAHRAGARAGDPYDHAPGMKAGRRQGCSSSSLPLRATCWTAQSACVAFIVGPLVGLFVVV